MAVELKIWLDVGCAEDEMRVLSAGILSFALEASAAPE